MKDIINTVISHFKSKLAVIALLGTAIYAYLCLPSGSPVPFAEIAYTAITIIAVPVMATLMRLMVFREVVDYAERGGLTLDLAGGKVTPAMLHYWFATFICYAVAALPLTTIGK